MKKILIVNGPNLNLLGRREPGIYGSEGFDDYLAALRKCYEGKADIDYFQSNCEGELIDRLQQAGFGEADGIVLNAGAYTHTSIALGDCIRAIKTPVEEFRHHSMLAAACKGVICGFGLDSYRLAVEAMISE